MQNRMREIRTVGSLRDGADNDPIYSAAPLGAPSRAEEDATARRLEAFVPRRPPRVWDFRRPRDRERSPLAHGFWLSGRSAACSGVSRVWLFTMHGSGGAPGALRT